MPSATTTRRRYRSGHCLSEHHENCRGAYGGIPCNCSCHLPCPTCHRPMPPAAPRRTLAQNMRTAFEDGGE